MRILIVEDSADSRLILKTTLTAEGHQVDEAVHGEEALEQARTHRPDLIISDILMPVMDGFQLCHAVKRDPDLAPIPFVFYTATYVDPEDAKLALSLGAARFLIKPLDPDAFLEAIAGVVAQTARGTLGVPPGPAESDGALSEHYRDSVARKLESKVRQLETYEGIFHNSDAAVAILSPRGEILRVNPSWVRRLGREAGVCKGMKASRFLDDDSGSRVDLALAHQEGVREEATAEVPGLGHRVFDLSLFPIQVHRAPVSDYVLILRDVTETRRTQDDLRWELRVNAAIAELSTALIAGDDSLDAVAQRVIEVGCALTESPHGYVGELNPQSRALIVRTLTTLFGEHCKLDPGTPVMDLPPGEDGIYPGLWGTSLNTRAPFYTNAPPNHPAAKGTPVGHLPLTRYLSVPVILGDDLVGQIGLANAPRDYTDKDLAAVGHLGRLFALALERQKHEEARAALEEQFLQTQKLEAVGQLAGGVAHDFNNLLMVMGGTAEILATRLETDAPSLSRVRDISKAVDRAAGLTRQLLAFSRKQLLQPRVVDLNRVVENLEKMLVRLIGEDVHFALDLQPGLSPVRIDPGQLEQVVMNLAINARDAMPGGGALLVRTRFEQLSAPRTTPHGDGIPAGAYVTLALEDTGTGMDAATLRRVFEPFFTTKAVGQGTGLGLSTVYGIVRQSGGHLWVESEVGRGSTFIVYLPPAPLEESARAAVAPSAPQPRGSETILLVEDEAGVRDVLRRQLQALGYRVLEAADGRAALEMARTIAEPIHLLFTDVVMPTMGGVELMEKLTAERPELAVIFASGYTGARPGSLRTVPEGAHFLQKPFSGDRLARAVRAALDPTPAGG